MDKVQMCMGPKNIDKEHTRTMPKVKVAILDTGIAHDHPTIKALKTIKSFSESDHWHKSFVVGGHPDKTSKKATQDTNGHGTHIAALFARVAPRAQIYIAKIAESTVIPTDNRIAEVRYTVSLSLQQ
jgi:subtilisin family serine protease